MADAVETIEKQQEDVVVETTSQEQVTTDTPEAETPPKKSAAMLELEADLKAIQAGEQPAGEPPPESTPEAKADKPTEPPSEPSDVDLEKIDKPTRDNWKEARKLIKKITAELKEAKAQPPKPSEAAAPEPPPVRPLPEPPKKPVLKPDFVFRTLAEAEAGERDASFGEEAKAYIRMNMSTKDVIGVLEAAEIGQYGERSAEIMALAQAWLPRIQAIEGSRDQEQKAAAQAEQIRQTSWHAVTQRNPELQQKDSPQFQEFAAANGEIVQNIPFLWELPQAPEIVERIVQWKRSENRAKELDTTNKGLIEELRALKKRLGIQQSPVSGGRPAPISGKPKTAKEQFAADLAEIHLG